MRVAIVAAAVALLLSVGTTAADTRDPPAVLRSAGCEDVDDEMGVSLAVAGRQWRFDLVGSWEYDLDRAAAMAAASSGEVGRQLDPLTCGIRHPREQA